jgi:hypothetical protein
MKPSRLAEELPKLMKDGDWVEHQKSHGRAYHTLRTLSLLRNADWLYAGTDKRGVIVYVYPYEGNMKELEEYEDGVYGKYFNW